MISLIHPSRSRPVKAKEASEKWLMNAGCDVEYILSIDFSDPDKAEYERLFKSPLISTNHNAVEAINAAAAVSKGNIIVVMSDDFDCPLQWGRRILEASAGKTDWIMKTPDGIQDWIITLPMMDRAYYERFGYVYHPQYKHMFCDTELSCVADLTGRKIEAQIEFTHNHYSTGRSEKDSVSDTADSTWQHGERLFMQRYRNNFGLINPPGKIKDSGMMNWIKGKL